jgi:uncharacterized membrane protein
MSRISLPRRPFLLVVAAEALLVAGLAGAAWHVWQSRATPPPAATIAAPPAPGRSDPAQLRPPQTSPPLPRPPTPGPVAGGPLPGIRTDPAFLDRQLRDINREQSSLEDLEWRVVKGATDAMRRYLERVVLPAVERAQRGGR